MEACFNLIGSKMASRTNNGKAYIYDVKTLTEEHVLEGHESEVSKIVFDSWGNNILTASADKTCRLWDVETGKCKQILEGHNDEIFSCAFNYDGDFFISACKDNSCKIGLQKIINLL